MQKRLLLPLFLSIGLVLQGCGSDEAKPAETPLAKVSVLSLQPQAVNFSENLPARVQAFRTAEIRPQVGGIIEKVLFNPNMFGRPGYAFVVSLCFQKKKKKFLCLCHKHLHNQD